MDQEVDLVARAVTLVSQVEALRASPCTLTGPDILHVAGPDGVWRVRMELARRGWWKICIYSPAPTSRVFYSSSGLRVFLNTHYGLTTRDLDIFESTVIDESQGTSASMLQVTLPANATARRVSRHCAQGDPDSAQDLCAVLIQSSFRSYLLRRAIHHQLTCEAAVKEAILKHEASRALTCTLHRNFGVSDASDRSVQARTLNRGVPIRPSVLPKHLNTVVPKCCSIHSLVTHAYEFTREQHRINATALFETESPRSHAFMGAKAIVRLAHYPLILGTLPLPNGTCQLGNGNVLVCTGNVLSASHLTLLKRRFGKTWHRHVSDMITTRDVAVYDLYDSAQRRKHLASMVIAKFAVRVHGVTSTAISIESIASCKTGCGGGGTLFNVCKSLLFTDAKDVKSGYLFAQCLNVPFWTFRMDTTVVARSLVHQLTVLIRDYVTDPDCEMRSHFVSLDDPATASPGP